MSGPQPSAGQPRISADADPSTPEQVGPGALRIVAGNPSEEEIAAVTAVLAAVLEAGAHADRPSAAARPRSGWERTQRALRDFDASRGWFLRG